MKSLRTIMAIGLALGALTLVGCGGGGGGATGSGTTSTTSGTSSTGTTGSSSSTASSGSTAAAPVAILLAASSPSIKTDGSNSTTITATVIDANNLPVSGATVNFSVPAGKGELGVATAGSTGVVTIPYKGVPSSGVPRVADDTDVITAKVVGTAIANTISIKVIASKYSLLLTTNRASLTSAGSTDPATITATVLDENKIAQGGQIVNFSATTGDFGASSGASAVGTGTVTIPYYAQSATSPDWTNHNAVITATIPGTSVTQTLPIQIVGSTVSVTPSQNTVPANQGAASDVTLVATAKDSGGSGVVGWIQFSIDASSTGTGSLSSTTSKTAATGIAPAVTLSATGAGNIVVNAKWLKSDPVTGLPTTTVTATTSTTIVATNAGTSYAVTSATDPASLALTLLGNKVVSVSVPAQISGKNVANVRFSTTLGTWLASGTKVSTVAPAASAASATLVAGTNSGKANVQIDALDASGNVITGGTLTLTYSFSAAKTATTQVSLQAASSTVAPSTQTTANSTTLTATLRDASNNTVGDATVLFEIVNPTGSGEQISPVIGITNSNGQATAEFTSGTSSTVGGLTLRATALDTGVAATAIVNVAGTAVSVTLGQANAITSTNANTTYTLPMSVLVVSNTGGAIQGATVTLSAFPTFWARGLRDATTCAPTYHVSALAPYVGLHWFANNDTDENDILSTAEGNTVDPISGVALGAIVPPHSAAGSLPPTVITDSSGVATFNLIYQKNYAHWVTTQVQAKVVVNGTESTNTLSFILPALTADMIPSCTLMDSPFGS